MHLFILRSELGDTTVLYLEKISSKKNKWKLLISHIHQHCEFPH